jgi:hypothetical protein
MSSPLTPLAGDTMTSQVDHRRLALLWAAAAAAVVLHNAEEWLLNMTGWIAGHQWLPGRSLHGDQTEFALVLAIVTAAVLALALTATATRPPWSAAMLLCLTWALIVNGISHIVLSLLSGSLMPGVLSGSTVLLPLGAYLIWRLPPVRWTPSTVTTTILAAAGLTAGAFALAALVTRL